MLGAPVPRPQDKNKLQTAGRLAARAGARAAIGLQQQADAAHQPEAVTSHHPSALYHVTVRPVTYVSCSRHLLALIVFFCVAARVEAIVWIACGLQTINQSINQFNRFI